jgi:hypothetical protein
MTTNTTSFGGYFVTGTRDRTAVLIGATFVSLKEERPEWLHEAVREAHFGDLPNDWIYSTCEAVCDAFDAGDFGTDEDEEHDAVHSFADSQVDVYTKDVFQWAADFCLSTTYSNAEEAAKDMGSDLAQGLEKAIQSIQFCAIEAITRIILDACKAATAEADESEGDA